MDFGSFALGAVGGAVVGLVAAAASDSTTAATKGCACSKGSKGSDAATHLDRIAARERALLERARRGDSPEKLSAGVNGLVKLYRAHASRTGQVLGAMDAQRVMRGLLDAAGRDGAAEVKRWRARGAR